MHIAGRAREAEVGEGSFFVSCWEFTGFCVNVLGRNEGGIFHVDDSGVNCRKLL